MAAGRPPVQTPLAPFLGLALVVLVAVAFRPALENGFVNWDDDKNFLDNPHYRGLGPANLLWAARTTWLGSYQPMAWILFEAEYAAVGLEPRGYHLASVALHAADAVILFALILALVGRGGEAAAVAGAAVYAVHPLRAEAVAWASCQGYLPCAGLAMLAVLAYVRSTPIGGAPRPAGLLACGALYVGAMLAHATAVGLPLVLLALDIYPLRRLGGDSGQRRRAWVEKLPFAVIGLLFIGLAFVARSRALAVVEQEAAGARLARAGFAVWFYPIKTVVPLDLAAVYSSRVPRTAYLAAIGGVLAMTVGLWLARRRHPGLLAAWLAYLAMVVPNSGLVRIGEPVADRYSYLPMIVASVLVAAGLDRLGDRSRRVAMAIVVGVVAGLLGLTRAQCRTWRDSEALWAHALRHGAASSPLAHNNLGAAFTARGHLSAAMKEYSEALRLDPEYAQSRNGLGVALAGQGKPAAAAVQYVEALRIRPGYAAAHNNLAVVLTRQGRFTSAADHLGEAIRLNPGYVPAYNNLGVALAGRGDYATAATRFAEATRLNPDYAEAWNNLATIRATCPEARHRDGREALDAATRACTLTAWRNPRFLSMLAAAHAESGDFDAAILWQTRAIALPGDDRAKEDYRSRLDLYRARRPYREPPVGAGDSDR